MCYKAPEQVWKNYLIWTCVVGFLAVLFLLIGIGGPPFIQSQIKAGVEKQLRLDDPNGPGFSLFQDWNQTADKVPPTYKTFNFWNLTNAEDWIAGRAKPRVSLCGPYSYREYKTRFNITWSEDRDIIQFRTWERYVYDPATSCPTCDPDNDLITTLNMPLQGVLAQIRTQIGDPYFAQIIVDMMMAYIQEKDGNYGIVVTYPAGQLAMGYKDPLLDLLVTKAGLPGISPIFGFQMPNSKTEQDAINDPTLGFIQWHTGKNDINLVQNYVMWQNQTDLRKYWLPGTDATVLKGSEGLQFQPFLDQSTNLVAFVDVIFRHAKLESNLTTKVQDIDLYRYQVKWSELIANTTENDQYFSNGPNGVMNISSGTMGVPTFLSLPCFFHADPWLRAQVDGMPDPNLDPLNNDILIDVEPITGTTMQATKKLQINIYIEPDTTGLFTDWKFAPIYFPTAFLEERGVITEELAKQFKSQVYLAMSVSKGARIVGVTVGCVLLVGFAVLCYVTVKKRRALYLSPLSDNRTHLLTGMADSHTTAVV
eukprot:gnl/Spiro4/524_TR287_c0_g2_i1.p1 gnl/Spiro4/524_TR287_c0_g2~~gnl/Spiro4/524_TR287_c0_g2_i1.p1  ORF type:complete len:536 (+),score=110.66 gnl/Spiro4/524_TR287_c0_g2_i1:143-1750(+)